MTSERQEIAAKVRALLAKTVDQGCTEQEAVAAAAKAKELIDRYQVDLSETELEDEGFVRGTAERSQQRKLNVQREIGTAIADYCDVKCWLDNTGYRQKLRYVWTSGWVPEARLQTIAQP